MAAYVRYIIVAAAALLLGVCPVFGQKLTVEERWEKKFKERMQVWIGLHNVHFDSDWEPRVIFGFPNTPFSTDTTYNAAYTTAKQIIYIAPRFRQRDVNSPNMVDMIDHELGHALADQISRRIGNGAWPYKGIATKEIRACKTIFIISEGIGTYFNYQGQVPITDGRREQEWLPQNRFDPVRRSKDWPYYGGRWIVAPIIRRYGEEGIEYLITRPFIYTGYNVQEAARQYQQMALSDLAAKEGARQ